MEKADFLKVIKKIDGLYSKYEVNPYDEIQSQNELFEKILKETAEISDPFERIKSIVENEAFENKELQLDVNILDQILDLIPKNQKASDYYSSIIPSNYGWEGALDIGLVFKECGETLEDIPFEYLAESDFLYGYITSLEQNDPNIKNYGWQDIKETRGEIIKRVKDGFSHEHSLSEIRDSIERLNPTIDKE